MKALLPLLLLIADAAQAQTPGRPIIDMHLHAFPLDFAAGVPACPGDGEVVLPAMDPRADFDPSLLANPCAEPILSPDSDEALMRDSLAALKQFNIRRAVTSEGWSGSRSGERQIRKGSFPPSNSPRSGR